MPRPDVSTKLIHFTSGATDEAAFETLHAIVREGALRASSAMIRGEHRCICFTEAPLAVMARGLVNLADFSTYRPFGVLFEKVYVFQEGGRPVIYQPDSDYALLPEALQWRHVRYEPIAADERAPIDFTWEREWRIACDRFPVDPRAAALVVPSQAWADRLRAVHALSQEDAVYAYSQIMDINLAEQFREEFPWRLIVLDRDV